MKDWLINVGIQKAGPSLIRAALAALVGVLLAHANDLSAIGIVYDKTTDTILWHLNSAREWAGTVGLGLIASLFTVAQHHATAAVTGQPQDGTHQRAEDVPGVK